MDTPFTLPGRLALSEEVAVKRNSNQLDCLINGCPRQSIESCHSFFICIYSIFKEGYAVGYNSQSTLWFSIKQIISIQYIICNKMKLRVNQNAEWMQSKTQSSYVLS